MNEFMWHRKDISFKEYQRDMGINSKVSQKDGVGLDISADGKKITIQQKTIDALCGSKLDRAYNATSDIRKFEISLFWQRALFFWGFITVTYTAYFTVLTKVYANGEGENSPYSHGELPLIALAALGLFFCFSWLLANIGSKHWQQNWEDHLDLLEDNVTGPLYKTYRAKSYSVSKIVTAAGWVVTAYGYALVLYEFASLIKSRLRNQSVSVYLTLVFAVAVPMLLFAYSRLMLGNLSESGETQFQRKVYE